MESLIGERDLQGHQDVAINDEVRNGQVAARNWYEPNDNWHIVKSGKDSAQSCSSGNATK